ncbi:GGDEF domain-containing protein [Paenibacillus sp. M1]|uniref:GGDEF domain-containing protein n=1 Tax=Paenibacillus haidiansis TaxID=1574488 RepID=A0ABU7VV69_9BACL
MMLFNLDMKTVFVLLALGHLFTVLLITAYRKGQPRDAAVNSFYAYGHDAGDDALRDLAAKMREKLREADLLGRYGGDEFAIMLPGADEQASAGFAEALRLSVEQGGEGLPLAYSISMGVVTTVPTPGVPLERLYKSSDIALYRAKQGGRNRVARGRIDGMAERVME